MEIYKELLERVAEPHQWHISGIVEGKPKIDRNKELLKMELGQKIHTIQLQIADPANTHQRPALQRTDRLMRRMCGATRDGLWVGSLISTLVNGQLVERGYGFGSRGRNMNQEWQDRLEVDGGNLIGLQVAGCVLQQAINNVLDQELPEAYEQRSRLKDVDIRANVIMSGIKSVRQDMSRVGLSV